jgi:hypothetical protein
MGEIDKYEESIGMADAVPMDNFKALLEEARTIRRQRDELARVLCPLMEGYQIECESVEEIFAEMQKEKADAK